jgi:hypothetical protein
MAHADEPPGTHSAMLKSSQAHSLLCIPAMASVSLDSQDSTAITIRALPADVLLRIFRYSTKVDHHLALPEDSLSTVDTGPLLLTHVCSMWRQFLHRTPSAWTSIGISLDTLGLAQIELLNCHVQRLIKSDVSISLYIHSKRCSRGSFENLAFSFSELQPLLSRCTRLALRLHDTDFPHDSSAFNPINWNSLKTLHIELRYISSSSVQAIPDMLAPIFQGHLPNLDTACMSTIFILGLSLPLDQLNTICAFDGSSGSLGSGPAIFHILEQAARLKKAAFLVHMTDPELSPDYPPLRTHKKHAVVRSLEHVDLEPGDSSGEVEGLMSDHITAENLTALAVSSESIRAAHNMLKASMSLDKLQNLTIRLLRQEDVLLVRDLLMDLPNLKKLKIQGDDTFEELSRDNWETKLAKICFSAAKTAHGMQQIVVSLRFLFNIKLLYDSLLECATQEGPSDSIDPETWLVSPSSPHQYINALAIYLPPSY